MHKCRNGRAPGQNTWARDGRPWGGERVALPLLADLSRRPRLPGCVNARPSPEELFEEYYQADKVSGRGAALDDFVSQLADLGERMRQLRR